MTNHRILLAGAAVAGVGAGLAAAGLQVLPAPFPAYPQADGPITRVPLPTDIPVPVIRWLVGHYGSELPIIHSVVISGRARMRPFGPWLQARFRFTHRAGIAYRHYIEATFAGRPILRVNESLVDGQARTEIPVAGTATGAKVNQAGNMSMWAELAMAAPAVLVTDPRVRWSGIDDQTALFTFPAVPGAPAAPADESQATDELVVRFDPETGALLSLEGWRYRSAADSNAILWLATVQPGSSVPGELVGPWHLPAVGTATWADQAEPWASFTTEEVVVNADVGADLNRRGL